MRNKQGFATQNIHVGEEYQPPVGSVNTPIYPTSTFIFPSPESGARRFTLKEKGMIYSRIQNPTVESLEQKLAALEGADQALGLASGMSAIATTLFHFLRRGDKIIAHKVLYGGTYQLLANILPKFGIEVELIDFKNFNLLKNSLTQNTKIAYFETPTNPLLEIIDIEKVSEICKKNNCITVLDNTFAPPYIQYPISSGIDIVIHSLTKYINGHSDVIAGAIIGSKNNISDIRYQTSTFLGGTMSPFTAFLISRAMQTLKERLNTHCKSAMKTAAWLESNSRVEQVFYPGLKSHPDHKIAAKQMRNGYGGVISFILKDGYQAGLSLMNKVNLASLAVSLGGTSSLIEHPASMTHSEYTDKERRKAGIDNGLIRLSIGLEETDDIISDLSQALSS